MPCIWRLDVDALEADIKAQEFSTVRVKSMAPDRASLFVTTRLGAQATREKFDAFKQNASSKTD